MQGHFLLLEEVKISLRNKCIWIRPELLSCVWGGLWSHVPGSMFLRRPCGAVQLRSPALQYQ